MAAVMPASSTTRFSVTIGKGIPRHVGAGDDVVDMVDRVDVVDMMQCSRLIIGLFFF